MRIILAFALALCALNVHAVPATIRITPTSFTDDGLGGTPSSFRLHRGCDLLAQTTGPIIADPAVAGSEYAFAGDTDQTYTICAVGVNNAGVGGFANVVTLSFEDVVIPPGKSTIVLECDVDPSSGVIANCVQTN